MAQLSHEAYKVAFDATFWARHDLRFAAFRPTVLDYEAVNYLHEITRQVPWIARKVEKNPASPRVSSKSSYDLVAFDVMMLRRRYQRTSFRPSTDAKIEYLLSLLDEIARFYAQNRVEASTNLMKLTWQPLQTNAPIGGLFYFSDPQLAELPLYAFTAFDCLESGAA